MGRFDYDARIEGLEVVDRYTLRLRLKQPDFNLPYVLAHEPTSALAREVVEAYADPGGRVMSNPVGTGPYRLAKWIRASRIFLEANPEFRGFVWDFQPGTDPEDARLVKEMKGKTMPRVGRIERPARVGATGQPVGKRLREEVEQDGRGRIVVPVVSGLHADGHALLADTERGAAERGVAFAGSRRQIGGPEIRVVPDEAAHAEVAGVAREHLSDGQIQAGDQVDDRRAREGAAEPEIAVDVEVPDRGRFKLHVEEILRGLTGSADLQNRLIAENYIYLEDSSPASRVRAFIGTSWLLISTPGSSLAQGP
jgi:hypothetical protein